MELVEFVVVVGLNVKTFGVVEVITSFVPVVGFDVVIGSVPCLL